MNNTARDVPEDLTNDDSQYLGDGQRDLEAHPQWERYDEPVYCTCGCTTAFVYTGEGEQKWTCEKCNQPITADICVECGEWCAPKHTTDGIIPMPYCADCYEEDG